jgi:hypothetical protein
MTAPLACPYCNAAVTVPTGTAAGQRVTCPRCGDAFTLHEPAETLSQAIQPQAAPTGVQAPPAPVPPQLGRRRWSNRMVAMVVLGVMGCMATAGLVLALMTVPERRANDTGLKARAHRPLAPPHEVPAEPLARVVAPHKLAALGYLPRDTGLIVGVHVAELQALPVGQRLLHEPFTFGKASLNVDAYAERIGLRLEDLDHLVVGLVMDQSLLPRLTMVLRTRNDFEPEELRVRLKGERVASADGRVIFRFSPPGRKLPFYMYCPDRRTAAIALVAEQLEAVPAQPVAGLAQLPRELQELLRTRSEPTSPLWVAGHVDNWSKSPARLVVTKKEDMERLTSLQTFGIWAEFERAVTVKGALRCKDAAAAKALDDSLRAPRRAANPSLKTVLDGPWLTLQVQVDLASIQKPVLP